MSQTRLVVLVGHPRPGSRTHAVALSIDTRDRRSRQRRSGPALPVAQIGAQVGGKPEATRGRDNRFERTFDDQHAVGRE